MNQQERDAGYNRGFVSFMKRSTAVNAKKAMDGHFIRELPITTSFSKHMTLPSTPICKQIDMLNHVEDHPHECIRVQIPSDAKQRELIDLTAQRVTKLLKGNKQNQKQTVNTFDKNGIIFEQLLIQHDKQHGTETFAFIYDPYHPHHIYYNWKCYSLAQPNDRVDNWRTSPFYMIVGSQLYIPPLMYSEEESQRIRRQFRPDRDNAAAAKQKLADELSVSVPKALNDQEEQHLLDLLRNVTLNRDTMAECMVFAILHSDQSADVVEIISESLTLPETPVIQKLARLYVVNDILYNIGADAMNIRNSSSYRQLFQQQLPAIMQSFHDDVLKNITGRISQTALKDRVYAVLRHWQDIAVYEAAFIKQLENVFLSSSSS